ncbi:DUF192 domain-containing protein [Actinomadura graeca]|uniref:DUF192 domain-containing protein n=1 Tax=Actinomadura graeca TaxID=2750812 RepID=A0ABX8R3C8_9ACTN|nr:DUF192 domain-containing protein [Actinomadura graeca]QXJ25600.1 DUF192 domain-containing protein [Actinomadura graeca]
MFLSSRLAPLLLLPLSGCSFVGGATYQPPVLPLVFSIDQDGRFAAKLVGGVTTPLGRFAIEGGLKEAGDDEMVIGISRDGDLGEQRFLLKGRARVAVCSDGPSITYVTAGAVRVNVRRTATTVRVVRADRVMADCAGGTPAAAVPGGGGRSIPREPVAGGRLDPAETATVMVALGGGVHRMALADTPRKTSLGMIGWTRADLGGRAGMLYRYPAPGYGSHVIGGYTFTTDLLFFDAGGRLIRGFTGQPCPLGSPSCQRYDPGFPFSYVIEAPNGNLPILPLGSLLRF